MRKFKFLVALAASSVIAATPGNAAALIGATKIRITSAATGVSDSWLQLGEVVALNTLGINVALGANGGTATSSSQYDMYTAPEKAIDGGSSNAYTASIFHSGSTSLNEFLDISFAAPQQLASLTIFGRDFCCQYRDVYNVSIFNSSNQSLYSGVLDARTGDPSSSGPAGSATVNFGNAVSGVPEPATWAMMIGGFGMVGGSMRCRRRQTKVTFAAA